MHSNQWRDFHNVSYRIGYSYLEKFTCRHTHFYRLPTKLREDIVFTYVFLSVQWGTHVTINHDELEFTVQGPSSPLDIRWLLKQVRLAQAGGMHLLERFLVYGYFCVRLCSKWIWMRMTHICNCLNMNENVKNEDGQYVVSHKRTATFWEGCNFVIPNLRRTDRFRALINGPLAILFQYELSPCM